MITKTSLGGRSVQQRQFITLFLVLVFVCGALFVLSSERLSPLGSPSQFKGTILVTTLFENVTNNKTNPLEGNVITIINNKNFNGQEMEFSSNMPSIRGTNITISEILENFARCRKQSISQQKQCEKVHRNSTLFWRSSKTDGFTHKADYENMDLASKCCAFNHTELMAPAPSNDMLPWEREYLSHGPLINLADTAWASKSSVKLSKDSKKKYYVGDDVTFLIQLRNGRNETRKLGGDNVRAWLVNGDLGAGVTATVKDNGDGSYLATCKLPWAGKAVVKATIAHTRELIRSSLYVRRLFTSSHWFTSVFKNSKASEATPCSPLPYLPGFSQAELCNLTQHNGGIPWYCGRPIKKSLSCSDIMGTIKIRYPSAQPLTKADEDLVRLTEDKRPFLIPNSLELVVEKRAKSKDQTISIPSSSCRQRDLNTTFKESMSTGYFYKKTWRPFSCTLPNVTKEFANNCLKNTTFILLGDSNTRVQMDVLRVLTKCTDKIIKTKVKWHAPLRCEIDKNKMSIQFFPQKLPFYGSMGEMITQKMLTSTVGKLDSIPATGKYIVMIHYFLHIAPFHPSITKTRMQHARDAVSRLLKRNPTSHVIIQSPHSSYGRNSKNKNKLNELLFYMTKDSFKGLGNRVLFMNTLDLTIANQNSNDHPEIANEFARFYLGHICGRL